MSDGMKEWQDAENKRVAGLTFNPVSREAVEAAIAARRNAGLAHGGFLYGTRHVIRDFRKPDGQEKVWSIEQKGDLDYDRCHDAMMAEMERIYYEAALTAALPHLLAAKDAEIAALREERDEWQAAMVDWTGPEATKALLAERDELVSLKNDLSGALQASTEDHKRGHARIAELSVKLEREVDCTQARGVLLDEQEREIAALRDALELIEPYQDAEGDWCVRLGSTYWLSPDSREAERIAGLRRAALEMRGGAKSPSITEETKV